MRRSGARLIYDLYDPETLETLERFAAAWPAAPAADGRLHARPPRMTPCAAAHHFLCASEKQRDLWLGALYAHRLIDPDRLRPRPELPLGDRRRPLRAARPRPPRPVAPARSAPPSPGSAPTTRSCSGTAASGRGSTRRLHGRGVRAARVARRPRARLVFLARRQPRRPGGAAERRRGAAGCSIGRCSSTTAGSPTRRGPAGCSRPTARWPPTATTWRRASPSAPACSTASGPACRSCAPPATSWPRGSSATGWARPCPPATTRRWPWPSRACSTRGRAAYAAPLAAVAADYAWPQVAAPLIAFVAAADGRPPPRLGAAGGGPWRREAGHQLRTVAYRLGHRRIQRTFAAARGARARLGR